MDRRYGSQGGGGAVTRSRKTQRDPALCRRLEIGVHIPQGIPEHPDPAAVSLSRVSGVRAKVCKDKEEASSDWY